VNAEEAVNFRTLEAAGLGTLKCVGEDVAVVLRYDNPECELALNPVYCMTATSCAGARP
jgi:hypothetical protein